MNNGFYLHDHSLSSLPGSFHWVACVYHGCYCVTRHGSAWRGSTGLSLSKPSYQVPSTSIYTQCYCIWNYFFWFFMFDEIFRKANQRISTSLVTVVRRERVATWTARTEMNHGRYCTLSALDFLYIDDDLELWPISHTRIFNVGIHMHDCK